MQEIPEEAFSDIIKELQRQPIQNNAYRKSVALGRSQVFGLVNKRSLPIDYSRWCWKRPYLFHLLIEFAKKYVPLDWNAITVNDNYKADKHRDRNNCGDSLVIAFGDFTGGHLKIYEGPLEGLHQIRNKPIIADFSKIYHSVEPFEGHRYSLVFYKVEVSSDVPGFSVVKENNKYLFKRGDEIITKGLPHPLKGVKRKIPSLVIEDKPTTIEFI